MTRGPQPPWPGSLEYALADIQAHAEEERAAKAKARDRERARQLYLDAGRPVPAWLDAPEPPKPLDASVCIESDDELLDRGRR